MIWITYNFLTHLTIQERFEQNYFFYLTERQDAYNFPYEFSHPDEYWYNHVANIDDTFDSSYETDNFDSVQPRSPSEKSRFKRGAIERQTGERFQTVRKRCRRVAQRTCGARNTPSKIYKTNRRTSSSFYPNGNLMTCHNDLLL